MKLTPSSEAVFRLQVFRSRISTFVTKAEVKSVWGGTTLSEYESKSSGQWRLREIKDNKYSVEKFDYATKFGMSFNIPFFVKYIGVTGSVAAGSAKENDDIDIFVVVKNHTSWIYRSLIMIKMYKQLAHVGDQDLNNSFCLNFISEERGLELENHDIFTFNELISIKSLKNDTYLETIWKENSWMKEFHMKLHEEYSSSRISNLIDLLYIPFNLSLFLLQILYMFITRHDPDFGRLLQNYKKGRIEFFPKSFREQKIQEFEDFYHVIEEKIGVEVEI